MFTRYPEPGRTKTRMIPLLGPDGAAALQRAMAEHTLMQARRLALRQDCRLEVRYTGADAEMLSDWLGPDMQYIHQGDGDLGKRMSCAFKNSFDDGNGRTVIVGTDCPGLTSEIMAEAFEALCKHDLVFCPATDGGYTLVGMSRFLPAVFENIAWGTDSVLKKTLAAVARTGASCRLLKPLADVDRPDDLSVWESRDQP